jgi:hypothetical protein
MDADSRRACLRRPRECFRQHYKTAIALVAGNVQPLRCSESKEPPQIIWAFDTTANTLTLNHLNRAIEIEPDYPLALSMSAWCQARKFVYNWTPKLDEVKAEALRLAKLAGDMNNDEPRVLTMLCAAHSNLGDLDLVWPPGTRRRCHGSERVCANDPNWCGP